jgi:hypothetical protein
MISDLVAGVRPLVDLQIGFLWLVLTQLFGNARDRAGRVIRRICVFRTSARRLGDFHLVWNTALQLLAFRKGQIHPHDE